jgi:cysteine desulfurase
VTSAVEHPAILEPCAERVRGGDHVTVVGVDSEGCVRLPEFEVALASPVALVSVMLAQNEVGTLQPIASIARMAHAAGALVHTDAAQAAGKIPVSVRALDVDYLSVAGHKLYAPKGVGALFVRRGAPFRPLLLGAGHEAGRRAGTENVAGIVGLGAACTLAKARLLQAGSVAALRDRLWQRLTRTIADCRLHGAGAERLPNTLSVGFGGADARAILRELSETVGVSAGAACHGDGAPSGVLAAMGVPAHYARGTVRFSLGYETTEDEIDRAAGLVIAAVERVRRS